MKLIFQIIAMFFCCKMAVAEQAVLHLHDRTQISTDRIIVAQVATCSGAGPLCKIIKSLDIGEAPDPGQGKSVKQGEILRMIADEGYDQLVLNKEISVQGSETIVEAVGFLVNNEDVKNDVEQQISAALPAIGNKRWSVSLSINSGKVQLASPTWTALVLGVEKFANELTLSRTPFVRRIQIRLKSENGRKSQRDLWGNVRFTPEYKSLTYSKMLEKGSIVQEDSVSETWVSFAQYMESNPTIKTEVFGLRTKMQARPGSLVRWNMLETVPLVNRGQEVKINILNGQVHLQAKGRAMSGGVSGSEIDVEIEGTKKRMLSRIVSAGEVEVKL